MSKCVTTFDGLEVVVGDNGDVIVESSLKNNLGETSTGKSIMLGSTHGWQKFDTPEGVCKINCLIIRMK